MSTNICPISFNILSHNNSINILNYSFESKAFKKYLYSLNLGIDIDLADEDEWIKTALNDKFDNNETLRLRNPLTNLPFSDYELKIIYNHYNS